MRLRLLRRRLTISAPRMAVRSALPWPFRWAILAIVFGFCAAIGLWAFEFGREIAGLDGSFKDEIVKMRAELTGLQREVVKVKDERDKAQLIANTAGTLVTAEKAAQDRLMAQNRQLESDNQRLRDDLGFFEQLIPNPVGAEGVAIRALQAEVFNGRQVKWQVLVIQPQKSPAEFDGQLELSFTGTQNGRAWTAGLANGPQSIRFRQYGRIDGVFELPAQTQLKGVSAKVQQGSVIRATQSIKL